MRISTEQEFDDIHATKPKIGIKILLSAYACEPDQGSEEGVGWNMALALSRVCEVWVLTRQIYWPSIKAYIDENSVHNLHFVCFEPFGWSEDWKGKQGAVQLHYYLWQIQAYSRATTLCQSVKFDVVHHVTYVKFWSPSFLSLLDIPFVWGPVGGGEATPKAFMQDFSSKAKAYEVLRDIAQRLGALDPFSRLTARRAVLSYATTPDTAKRVMKMGAHSVEVLSESGLSPKDIEALAQCPNVSILSGVQMRFVSIGRLLHWKGYHLSVQAFLAADLPNAEYWLIGNGPESENLQRLVDDAGAAERIKLWGYLPREIALEKLGQSHVVVHPSLHDSGGWTCLEAMAAGRPVICMALGGPNVQVTSETGIKIPATNPAQAVAQMAEAMHQLATDRELMHDMGQAGRQRIQAEFLWEAKAQYFYRRYCEAVRN